MEPLSPRARAALDAYRREHSPSPQALRSVQQQLAAHARAPRDVWPRLRALAGSALAAALLGVVVAWRTPDPIALRTHDPVHEPAHAPHVASFAAERALVAPAKRVRRAKPVEGQPAPEPVPKMVEVEPVELALAPTSDLPSVPPASIAPPTPLRPTTTREPDSSLDAEVMQLRTAYDLLRAHAPLRALSALREHARRFPAGKLRELADVARVLALCDAEQRTAAQQATQSFLRAYPSSIHTARVRDACP